MSSLCQEDQPVLVVVDMQDKFRGVIDRFDEVLANCVKLIRAFQVLGRPVILTEQYPQGLGETVPEILKVASNLSIIEKTSFSCLGSAEFCEALKSTKAKTVVLAGIEAHVCVNQTAHHLLDNDYDVHVVRDAISSRKASNTDVAFTKMITSGAAASSAEMAIFEMVGGKRHEKFKEISGVFK